MDLTGIEKTILLVDDEEDIRDVLGISLSDMGFEVHAVENGEKALSVFNKINPLIVLTDIKMPGMDGIELLRRIKSQNPDTEVVMITGHGDMNLAIKSLKYEATDFITKPINVDALEIALKRAHDRIIMRLKLKEYTESLEALIREKTELQDHLSSLGLMIGSISHGIKGLLTGLDGGMYLLDSGFKKKDQDQIDEGWDVLKLMVERIRKMIQDILFYTKKRELKRKKVNVVEFAQDLIRVVETKFNENTVTLKKNYDSSLKTFEIDTSAIHSALLNILENAIDACTKDHLKTAHTIEFNARPDGEFVLFEVSDNGIGMSKETVEKVFKLFYSSKGDKGTGLGLFISNKTVRQHGGSIQVDSTPNLGTHFSVRIPKTPPKAVKKT